MITGAVEYGEGISPMVLNTKRGIERAGYCFACDLGYEGDECTCCAVRIVVYLCNGAMPVRGQHG